MKEKLLSFENVEKILNSQKELISSQLGYDTEIRLEKNTKTSFYSLTQDYISICYPQIVILFKAFAEKNKTIDCQDLIRFIRTLLFHEFGHIMFTNMTQIPRNKHSIEFAIFNILEDERIEMNMEKYFTNIDFKEVLALLCPIEEVDTSIKLNQFFNLVRHGEVQNLPEDKDRLAEIKASVAYHYRWYASYTPDFIANIDEDLVSFNQIVDQFLVDKIDSYLDAYSVRYIADLYFEPGENSNPPQNSTDLSEFTEEELENTVEDIVNKVEDLISNEMSDGEVDDYLDELKQTSAVSPYEDEGEVKERFEKNNIIENNQKLENDLIYIFESVNRQDKMNAAAINSYSGRFDPRAVIRNDYKYFLKSGQGNQKGNAKLHLNLVVDRSGSMWNNEQKIRSLIKAVDQVCKKVDKLTYTLLSIGNNLRIEDPRTYIYSADGGNSFKPEMFDIMKSVQQKATMNYNLILFDGEACWHTDGCYGAAFNGANYCIISDPENRSWLNEYCQDSRVVITDDYYNTFEKELIKSLNAIVK